MPEERRLDQVLLKVDGRPLERGLYDRITEVRVEESVHLPDAFTIRIEDAHFTVFDAMIFEIGSKLDIAFSGEGEMVTVTRGEITCISMEPGPGGLHELVLFGMDATHRLARGTKSRSFQQMTDADIVAQVVSDYGFSHDIDPTNEVHEYVLQSSQTDYAFLKQRAQRIGFDVWVADETLHFKPDPNAETTPPTLVWGENLSRFKTRFSSTERCDEVTVRGWDPVAKQAIVGRADSGATGTTAPAADDFATAARRAFGPVKRFAGQQPVTSQRAADALAHSLLLRASGAEVTSRGEAAGDPLIAAGATVTIGQMGEKLSGDYCVTSVEHVYAPGSPYVTRFVCGGKDPGTFADLVTGNGKGAGASGNGNGPWGSLVVGVVTDNNDPESLGRVRVKFPTLTDSDESAWAKVVAPGAGDSRGIECVPEVNDEVLIGFEHDDPNRPFLLGGLWNRSDPPPESPISAGKVTTRSWTSRNGHRILLSDDDSEGEVTITLGDASSSLTIKRSQAALTGEAKIALEGQDIEIKAQNRLILDGTNIEIKGGAEAKVNAPIVRLN